jgi:ABC-type bacteriocin/lantibiotic exporter with double-glycine peptidase domain
MIIASFIEALSIGLVIPVVSFFLNPDVDNKYYEYVYYFYSKFDILSPVLFVMISLLIIYLFKFLYLIFFNRTQGKYLLDIKASLSKKMFECYLLKPYSFHIKHNSSLLIRNIESEIGVMINNFISPCLVFTLNLLTVFCITILLIFYDFLSTITIISVFLLTAILLNLIFKKKLTDIGKSRQVHQRFNLQHLRQGFGSIKEIKLLGIENYFINKFNFHNLELAKIGLKRVVIGVIPKLTFEYLFLIIIFILILSVELSNESFETLLPTLVIYSICAFRLMPALNAITISYQKIKYGVAALAIVYEQLSTYQEININKTNYEKINFNKEINVKNIYFSYPASSKQIVNDVSLSIQKNKTVGIIGKNGSGKSTLLNLVCGLSEPTSGIVEIDGKDIKESLIGWQRTIGYVPQSIYLSDDTLLSNIAIGVDTSKINKESLTKAIKLAQLDQMVTELPKGLETMMGEKGINISGGQKQKIGIARVLYRDPEILIFDEATSSMDLSSEQKFTEDLNKFYSQKTIIIVAHRLSALKYCEKIYNIKSNKIYLEKGLNNI